jgi:hypothetical protein
MAVTKQTYTQNATWTASQHAALVRTAFIDAGLMTEWYDSFLSGSIENRILEVQYDANKTYGKTYYWFMFSGSTLYFALATGWNAITHVPTGTQYLDYFSTTTNAITNHRLIASFSASTTLTITRYQSAVDTNFSWFLMRNGATSLNFHIPHSSVANKLMSWVDLNKTFFHHFLICEPSTTTLYADIKFRQYFGLRRSYASFGQALRGSTSAALYGIGSNPSTFTEIVVANYGGVGLGTATTFNLLNANPPYSTTLSTTPVLLPIHTTTNNPAYTTDQIPVFTGAQYSQYLFKSLPSDFGITFHYVNNTMTLQDTLVVSSGTEEWEIVAFTNNGTITTGASPIFLARTVG